MVTVGPRRLAYGVVTMPETCRAVEAATGVYSGTAREMHLEMFDGSVLDLTGVRVGDRESVRRAEGREWVQFFASRVCPACLAASGGVWPVWWKLSWAAVCPAHQTLLVDLCPRCRVSVRRGPAGRPARLSRSRMPTPLRCGAVLGGTVCDQPIPQIGTSVVSSKLADQQQLVLEVVMHRRPALIAGQVVSAGQWFAALKATAMLVRLGMPEVLPLLDAPLDGQGGDCKLTADLMIKEETLDVRDRRGVAVHERTACRAGPLDDGRAADLDARQSGP
ncbi:TniQ family protein [Nonomuraea sp. GTA35]|uniref:TniQ family protein n=1 Tax=Nonomuraea sp. GTA35 TaxID=1676746 RepID=UPI0035C1B45B